MNTYERSASIIADSLPQRGSETPLDAADRILRALLAKRITTTTMRASASMFTRWHAHCRFLGTQTGYGYEHWYNEAVNWAVEQDSWPVKLIAKTISIDGHEITVDIQVPQSTTRASNRQLLCAYEVISGGAEEHGVVLPEHWENE